VADAEEYTDGDRWWWSLGSGVWRFDRPTDAMAQIKGALW
jgi:hypothetical protein